MTINPNRPNLAKDPTEKMQKLGSALIDVFLELETKSVILGLESEADSGAESLVVIGVLLATENRIEYAEEMSALHQSLIKKFREATKS